MSVTSVSMYHKAGELSEICEIVGCRVQVCCEVVYMYLLGLCIDPDMPEA